jgi:ATPase subunit of ABC transporter with duplicated ATPase domains
MVSKVIAITLGTLVAAVLLVGGAVYITSTRYASREAKAAAERAEQQRALAQSSARKAAAQRAAAVRKAAAASKAAAVEKAKAAEARNQASRSATQGRPQGTPCQRMYDSGVPLYQAYNAWARAGYPTSWDADGDAIPCERSYGEVN